MQEGPMYSHAKRELAEFGALLMSDEILAALAALPH
jgi:hypothetical protein